MRRNINFNRYREITEYANKQIDRVRSNYVWLASLLTFIIVIGTGLIAFFSYQNMSDLRKEWRDETDTILSKMNSRYDLIAEKLKFDLEKEVFFIEQQVQQRINAEFDRENIRKLVEATASEKISQYSEVIIHDKIKTDVQPLFEKTSQDLNLLKQKISETRTINQQNLEQAQENIDRLIKQTKSKSDSLQLISEFIMNVTSAQGGDRIAWDKLKSLAENSSFIFSDKAADAYVKIKDDYSNPFYLEPFIDTLKYKVDSKIVKMSMLINDYNHFLFQQDDIMNRLSIIKSIWERKDFKLREKLEFLIYVMEKDKHLVCVRFVGKLFAEATKLSIKYLAVDYFTNWWSKNKDKYH